MSNEQETQERVKSKKKASKAKAKKTDKAEFLKEVLGKLTTFYGTKDSDIQTMQGVPMTIVTDPDGRSLVKMYSDDGSRAYLYLDQIAALYTHGAQEGTGRGQEPEPEPALDRNAVDPAKLKGKGGYNTPIGGQMPDEIHYSRRGQQTVKHVPRTERADG